MNVKPLNILLVEDNYDHAELIRRSFEENRVVNKIYHVADGEQALTYLYNSINNTDLDYQMPNLVLLDLRLPKIDGLEVLKTIKTNDELKKIPVVILTSSDTETDVAKAYDYFANSYLVKPLDFDKFVNLMNIMGFYWLGWNINPK